MKFPRVEIENFMAIGHAEIGLDDRGLVLIEGENGDDSSQDSNGAGKSSIPDAIDWCLYGVTARGESGDEVVNRTAKKNARVMVEIDDDGQVYHVIRHRKHAKGKNRLHLLDVTNSKELTGGTDKITQALLLKILGASQEVFCGSIYAGQEQMPDLPSMTDKALKVLVEEAAGVDKLSKGYAIARERARTAQRVVEVIEDKIQRVDASINQQAGTLKYQEQQIESWEDGRKTALNSFLSQVGTLKLSLAEKSQDLAQIDRQAASDAVAVLNSKLSNLDSEKKRHAELQEALSKVRSELDRKATQARLIKSDIDSIKVEIGDINALVGQPCGECHREYSEKDLEGAVEARSAQITQKTSSLRAAATEAKSVKDELESAQKALDNYAKSMTDATQIIKERDAHEREIARHVMISKAVDDIKADLEKLVESYKERRDQENPHAATLDHVKQNVASLKAQEKLLKEDLVTAQKTLEIANDVVKVFAPAGVRAHVLDTVTPFLNDRTSEYLGALSDGNITAMWSTINLTAAGEAREKFAIQVKSATGGSTFKSLSGGEKRKVRLACAMALQDLVASRASKPIELFMADEIDDAVDAAGLERLMTVLDKKARERGTVLVVSHNDLSDWITDSVTVVKSGGQSRIEGSALNV